MTPDQLRFVEILEEAKRLVPNATGIFVCVASDEGAMKILWHNVNTGPIRLQLLGLLSVATHAIQTQTLEAYKGSEKSGSEKSGTALRIVPALDPDPRKGKVEDMSYDIRLVDPVTRESLHAENPHQIAGGTRALGGTTELWLNVTYNYQAVFARVFDSPKGIRSIYGISGAESILILKRAAAQLGDDANEDYWKPTEGNVKKAIHGLLALAHMRPDGIWAGD